MSETNGGNNIFGGAIPEKILAMGEWNKSPLKFFTKYDGPFVKREVVIGNHALLKILQKNFEYMSRNLFFVSAFGRFLLRDEKIEAVLEAENIADRTIENAIKSVQNRIAQAETLLKAKDIPADAQNAKLATLEVPLTSPGARKYIELLLMADHFYNLNASLWIAGEIDNATKFANESVVRKDVQAAVRGIANQFGYILNLTRKKDAAEAAKVGEHDEAALATAAEREIDSLGTTSVSTAPAAEAPAAGPGEPAAAADGKEKKSRAKKAAAGEPAAA